MGDLVAVLQDIQDSLSKTSDSIEKLESVYDGLEIGDVQNKIQKSVLKTDLKNEKVSLLSLKNGSMLGYLASLMMVIKSKLDIENGGDALANDAREQSIEHRVVLEKGVKPLESKLSYQLDKLTKAYSRLEKEYVDAEKRALEKSDNVNDDGESDESSEEEDEELSYRPNALSMVKAAPIGKHRSKIEEEEEEEEESGKQGAYKPPKISAVLPSQQNHFDDRFNAQEHKDRSNRSRMQAMEEFINENSEQPDWESSIGANIVNHGKGGIKSSRDTQKERQVKDYEEDNFTRLNMQTNKMEKRKQKQRERMAKVNMIGGEDFSIFNSKRKMEDSTSRRNNKKTRSAWDRAKRKL